MAYIHTYIHTYMYTYIYTCIQKYGYTHAYTICTHDLLNRPCWYIRQAWRFLVKFRSLILTLKPKGYAFKQEFILFTSIYYIYIPSDQE
jgi:hypothetical protein